jgi:glucuronate isomerase
MELKRFFDIDKLLGPETAREIWEICNAKLNTPEYSVRNLIRMANVQVICTTDDPIDSLEHHKTIQQSGFEVKVLPAWRPDRALAVEDPETFNEYVDRLAEAADTDIRSFGDFMDALDKRHEYFHAEGCRLSDHGLETAYAEDFEEGEIETIFTIVRDGGRLSPDEISKFKSFMLYEFGIMDHRRGWVQQYHLGALRNNNTRLYRKLGPDTGFDSIGDLEMGRSLSKMLDRLDTGNRLAKTILYNLNPKDNDLFATMTGNFQDGSVPGKMQYGAAWWFLDQKDGMEKQIQTLSNLGLLSRFVGMLTDSRSFLSYVRHEYFRRTLCNILGEDVECGEIPDNPEWLGKMVREICFDNARNYFNFP